MDYDEVYYDKWNELLSDYTETTSDKELAEEFHAWLEKQSLEIRRSFRDHLGDKFNEFVSEWVEAMQYKYQD